MRITPVMRWLMQFLTVWWSVLHLCGVEILVVNGGGFVHYLVETD
jgi:hypothetical protein